MPITLDAGRAPLFVISMSGRPSDREFAALLAEMTRRFFVEPRPYAVIYRGTGFVSAQQRRMQAAWLAEHDAFIRRWGAVAFAFDSPVLRGIVRAIYWVQPPACPWAVSAGFDEAVAWAARWFHRRGVTPPRGLPDPPHDGLTALSARERRIVELASHGLTNREVAEILELSPNTVRNHLAEIFTSLGVTTRSELVRRVLVGAVEEFPPSR